MKRTALLTLVLLAMLALLAFMVDSALAEVVAPKSTTTTTVVDYSPAFGWMQPYVIEAVSTLVAAAASWLIYLFQKWTGIKIDQALSQGFVLNAQNQASGLVAKGFVVIRENGKVEIQSAALAAAVNDLLKSVPDAVTRFELKPAAIAEKITAMVPQVPAAPVVLAGTARTPHA